MGLALLAFSLEELTSKARHPFRLLLGPFNEVRRQEDVRINISLRSRTWFSSTLG
jgi:hypothetical protein